MLVLNGKQSFMHHVNFFFLYLEDAFDTLPLWVVTVITVQLAVRIANKLQQSLGLNVHQHRVLEGTAVLRQRLQAAFSNPFLKNEGKGVKWEMSTTSATPTFRFKYQDKLCHPKQA